MDIFTDKAPAGNLIYNEETREFIFNYTHDRPISLTIPYSSKSYTSHYHLHPIFDMHMPEGYLFEMLKNLLAKKHGKLDDYTLFTHLSKNIEGYITYDDGHKEETALDLEDIINDEDENLFSKLVKMFLNNSAIAGVQPKVLATLQDKATLSAKEYIVKSFGDEYPHLAENEYFCMKALGYAGIKTPKFWLSKNKQLFIVDKFTYKKEKDSFYGFEEFCVLFGHNKDKKYYGSYEQIAKAIAKISTQKKTDLEQFFKMTVMNYLLKNGDAHLKNFGILYEAGMQNRFLAPAYDVVCTNIYLPKDKPALTLLGKKVWFSKVDLVTFGQKYCLLTQKEAEACSEVCIEAVKTIRGEIMQYAKENDEFKSFSERFVKILDFSLCENSSKTYKDVSHGIL
jgi:serine/threonine-protein kinase HipA